MREGRLKPGDRLPSERAMCEAFGVSRVTVREALRILEASELIEIRVGARGGAMVIEPSHARMRQDIEDLVALGSLTGAQLTEAVLEILAEALRHPLPHATSQRPPAGGEDRPRRRPATGRRRPPAPSTLS